MSLVYIFTGTGKGKTSAALGMVLRARCADMKVAWLAWYKEASWDVSEYKMEKLLDVDLFIGGKGFYFKDKQTTLKTGNAHVKKTNVGAVADTTTEQTHKQAAQATLDKAMELVTSQTYDLIICDELCQAVAEDLVDIQEVLKLIGRRGETHVVLTGRFCPQALIDVAHTVSEIRPLKHAYDEGIPAMKGLDF